MSKYICMQDVDGIRTYSVGNESIAVGANDAPEYGVETVRGDSIRVSNLTPHTVGLAVGEQTLTIPSEGRALLVMETLHRPDLVMGIPTVQNTVKGVEGLPEPDGQTIYIVSAMVAGYVMRKDVVSPDTGPTAIREAGQVKAVRGFVRYV